MCMSYVKQIYSYEHTRFWIIHCNRSIANNVFWHSAYWISGIRSNIRIWYESVGSQLNTKMTDKMTPQRVPAALFGSSSQTTDLLGMSDDFLMASPVTLGVSTSSSKETSKETTKAPSPLSSSKSSPSHSLTSSPLAKRKDPMRAVSSPATTDVTSAELTTIPLNSPPPGAKGEASNAPVGGTQQQVPIFTSASQPLLQTPTLSDKRSVPQLSTQPQEDDYPIQPVVKTDTPVAKPPSMKDPAVTANPYRLSAQQQKKPMFPSSPYLSSPQSTATVASQGPSFMPPPMASAPSSLPPPASQSYGAPPMATQQQQHHHPAMQQHPAALGTAPTANNGLAPVRPHWFYKRTGEDHWTPFSCVDSARLEQHFLTPRDQQQQEEIVIPTDGGRYDVKFHQRVRQAIFWEEDVCPVRRCTWFYRTDSDRWLQPYEENVAKLLEVSPLYCCTRSHNKFTILCLYSEYINTLIIKNTSIIWLSLVSQLATCMKNPTTLLIII